MFLYYKSMFVPNVRPWTMNMDIAMMYSSTCQHNMTGNVASVVFKTAWRRRWKCITLPSVYV